MLDCATCQKEQSVADREAMRCGFLDLPPLGEKAFARGVPLSDRAGRLETCPGYTTDLPDVQDIRSLFRHWKSGSLEHRLGGQKPTLAALVGLEALEIGFEQLEAEILSNASQGGR